MGHLGRLYSAVQHSSAVAFMTLLAAVPSVECGVIVCDVNVLFLFGAIKPICLVTRSRN